MLRIAWAFPPTLLLALLSCGGDAVPIGDGDADTDADTDSDTDSDSDSDCDESVESAPPETPRILNPGAGRTDVVPEELVVQASAFSDPDGDAHDASEFEIWVAPGGERQERVWWAQIEGGPRLTQVRLVDGAFSVGSNLLEWADYVVRARYLDASGGCDAWSDWSEEILFRTRSYFFNADTVHTFELEIPPESWNAMNREARPPGCVQFMRHFQPGTLIFEGERYEGVGIRLKGGCGSARDLDGKAAFKVSLNWDDPDVPGCPKVERRIHGLERFTFNNGIQDWTQEHEQMGFHLYREMGVPAPRVGLARIYVNGELYGLYVHVETIDRRFLRDWFADNSGMLYEGAYWCDLLPWNVPEVGDDSCFQREFRDDPCDGPPEPGDDPQDWELLRDLTERIQDLPPGGFYDGIYDFFDFDTFLSMWAVDGMIAHWDAYSFHIVNNYRVYHDPSTDIWTMIPWGIDQTFRGDLDPWSTDAILVRRCLSEPACEDAYAERLEAAAAKYEELDFGTEAQRIYDVVAPHIREDPRKEYNNEQYANAYRELVTWIPWRPERVRDILRWRGY